MSIHDLITEANEHSDYLHDLVLDIKNYLANKDHSIHDRWKIFEQVKFLLPCKSDGHGFIAELGNCLFDHFVEVNEWKCGDRIYYVDLLIAIEQYDKKYNMLWNIDDWKSVVLFMGNGSFIYRA